MQSAITVPHLEVRAVSQPQRSAAAFAAVCAGFALLALALAAFAPIGFSIATVFLFAGPHNWAEFRYFLARMPARWGYLTPFFAVAIGGMVLLGAAQIALTYTIRNAYWTAGTHRLASMSWLMLITIWVVALCLLRAREPGCAKLRWAAPVGAAVLALVAHWPVECFYALIYIHPLIALSFLDREIKLRRPEWRSAYRMFLAALPLLLLALYVFATRSSELFETDALSFRIIHHAGSSVMADLPARFLVGAHTFLEMLHYSVWLVALPLLALRGAPWKLNTVALARRSLTWKRVLAGGLAAGAIVVVLLWGAFLTDYGAARDIYFTLAVFHVLAEFPFLVRLA